MMISPVYGSSKDNTLGVSGDEHNHSITTMWYRLTTTPIPGSHHHLWCRVDGQIGSVGAGWRRHAPHTCTMILYCALSPGDALCRHPPRQLGPGTKANTAILLYRVSTKFRDQTTLGSNTKPSKYTFFGTRHPPKASHWKRQALTQRSACPHRP